MEDPSLRINWLVWEEEVVLVASTGEMSEIRGSSGLRVRKGNGRGVESLKREAKV